MSQPLFTSAAFPPSSLPSLFLPPLYQQRLCLYSALLSLRSTRAMPPTAAKRKSPSDDEITTPTGSPSKRLRITRQQKQALVDNLQLESMHMALFNVYPC